MIDSPVKKMKAGENANCFTVNYPRVIYGKNEFVKRKGVVLFLF